MKRSTTRWTTAFAATALLGLPAAGWAQTGSAAQQPPAATAPAAAQNDAAQEHLKQAKAALDEIAPTAVTGRAKTQLTEIKRHLAALERASAAKPTASAQRSTAAAKSRASASWGTEVAAIDKILAQMLGSASGTGTAGTTGTTGTATPKAGAAAATLDDATRAKLTEVREHVTKFAAAMSGTASTPRTDDAAASTATSTTGTTSSAAGTSATGTGATGATGTSATGSTTAQPPATGTETPQTTPQAQVDTDAARRHLTEARDTLSQLTQLPAAATLTGDARTQVAQLISNFNELITTQADWRASYNKVEANLNALLGPEDAAAAATTTTTPPATATGTAGAVGTSGTTAAATLDPAVRTKLMELRAKLTEFERVAGGASTAANPAAGTTSGVTTGSASSVTSGTTTSGTTAATGSTTGTSATGSTASTEPQQQPATGAMSNADAMRHIQAIEAILKLDASSTSATAGTTGTTGAAGTTGSANASVTLTKAQLDELRTHLSELKKSIEKK